MLSKQMKIDNYFKPAWKVKNDYVKITPLNIVEQFQCDIAKREYFKPILLTKEWMLNFGFKEIPHFTVGDTLILDIDRNRQLSFSNIGTPNEMLFLSQINENDNKKVDDLVCIHNFDYDGYMHVHELQNICSTYKIELSL